MLCLVLCLPPALAAQEIRTLQASHQDSNAALIWDGERAVVEVDGKVSALPRSRDLSWRDLEIGDQGWIAAGSRWRKEGRSELVLRQQRGDRSQRLRVPRKRTGDRRAPQLLLHDDELVGLVWQEATDGLGGIRYAQRLGKGWSAPIWLSPPGDNQQLALSATALPHGGAIAVWSAFDGHDDEIVYSILIDESWSAPRRVSANNAVPDVTPTVAATASGAVVAWSQFDGHDYRLRVSRLEGQRWRGERWLGTAGSAFPVFHADSVRHDLGARLIYRSAGEATWNVADFDRLGYLRRHRSLHTDRRDPPLLRQSSERGSYFSWPRRIPQLEEPR